MDAMLKQLTRIAQTLERIEALLLSADEARRARIVAGSSVGPVFIPSQADPK